MGISASKPAAAIRPGVIITLDAQGTLYNFREPIARQYINVAARCGLTDKIEEDELKQAFRESFKEISKEYPNYGKGQLKSPTAWWKTLVNDTFRQVVDDSKIPDHLGEEMYNHFTSAAAYELYPDVKPFFQSMRELKAQWPSPNDAPIFVGVISNGDPRVKNILQSLGLRVGLHSLPQEPSFAEKVKEATDVTKAATPEGLMKSPWFNEYNTLKDIDFLATSYDADAEKPNPRIFDFAGSLASVVFASKIEQTRTDWKPSMDLIKFKLRIPEMIKSLEQGTCIHIGDDYKKDYEAALSADWNALYLARDGVEEAHKDATAVSNLGEAAAAVNLMVNQHMRLPEK